MNKFAKRSVSFVTAMFMSIMSMVTGISPTTFSANPVPNVSGTDTETDDVTLLVGKDSKLRGNDIASTIKNYEKSYALGIASQFCLFLRDDFTPNNSDAEGRVAVGGNIISETGNKEYEAGNGDFTGHISLDELIKNSGYANVIVNGTAEGLIPTSWNEYTLADGTKGYPEKKFWVKDKDSFTPSKNFTDNAGNRWSGDINDYLYEGSTAFNVSDYFDKTLGGISDKLLNQKSETSYKINSSGPMISYFNQWSPDQYKGNFQDMKPDGETVFTYTGSPNAKTVYFNLTEEDWNKISNTQVFSFKGIPDEAYIVVNVAGKEIDINKVGEDRYTYINDKAISKGSFTVVKADGTIVPVADVNKVLKGNFEYDNAKFQKELDKLMIANFGEGYTITGMFNNYEDVDRILYNFHEAENISYKKAFQGTIFAPNAHVDSEQGHLSGALIAKSAEGGMEFGYRPFQGPISMLGTKSGYALDFSKLDDDEKPLAGATIGLVVENSEVVSDIETDGQKYNFITLPSSIEDKEVKEGDELSADYTLKEISAPAGYKLANTEYPVRIVEKIKKIETINDMTVPSEVEVSVYRGKAGEPLPTDEAELNKLRIRHLVYVDKFDEDGNQTSREITIKSHIEGLAGEGEDVPIEIKFTLDIEDGTVKKVTQLFEEKETNPFAVDETTNPNKLTVGKSGIFNVKWNNIDSYYYYDVDNMMITRIPEGNVPEFVNEAQKIRLVKVAASDGTVLTGGAEVEVYKAEDIDKADREPVANGTTDENGVLELGHLNPGEYYIHEVKAPEGYITPSADIYFKVTADYKIEGESSASESYKITYTVESGGKTSDSFNATIIDSSKTTLRNGIPSKSV
ncbi:MAG: choice-of-anchor A family protein, partial [Ruminococcus sp.]|nr:choice-of-anchor A family protein [Ruminococcus sp.]